MSEWRAVDVWRLDALLWMTVLMVMSDRIQLAAGALHEGNRVVWVG